MSAKPEADPQLGRTLGGQYRIEALLGAGGMGRVYRGRQLSVNRPVAIKLIAGQAPYPPEWVRRFRREAEATASLSHPNSVRLFDFGVTESEELFMVMELLEGCDLARQLQAHGPLPLVAALAIARQVLLALCEAHALGITHRDIKPDNIFLASVRGADVVAKVMDFGIAGIAQAQRKSRLTGAGMIIGTPMYMSPEQAQGLRVDGKSDVYSLGIVLFEMLTGRPIFESHTAVTLLLAHVARAPTRLEEAGVQLREQSNLQALLDRLLDKDPQERPSAAEALETVTALSTRLGIAGATGSMRAIDIDATAIPNARRGKSSSAPAAADDGPAQSTSVADSRAPRGATPPSAALSDQSRLAEKNIRAPRGAATSALSNEDLAPARSAAPPSAALSDQSRLVEKNIRAPRGAATSALSNEDLAPARSAAQPSTALSDQSRLAEKNIRAPRGTATSALSNEDLAPRGLRGESSCVPGSTPPSAAVSGLERARRGLRTGSGAASRSPQRSLDAADGRPARSPTPPAALFHEDPAQRGPTTGRGPHASSDEDRTRRGVATDGRSRDLIQPSAAHADGRTPPSAAATSLESSEDPIQREAGLVPETDDTGLARSARQFRRARMASAPTGAWLRPGFALLGTALVLGAASALAFRWGPTLIEAARPAAAMITEAATPPPAYEARTVLINSQPSGASVLVAGEKLGTTPFQLKVRGDTEISVARDGYVRQLVQVPYGARAPLHVKLAAQPIDKSHTREPAPTGDDPIALSRRQESHSRADNERHDRSTLPATESEPVGRADRDSTPATNSGDERRDRRAQPPPAALAVRDSGDRADRDFPRAADSGDERHDRSTLPPTERESLGRADHDSTPAANSGDERRDRQTQPPSKREPVERADRDSTHAANSGDERRDRQTQPPSKREPVERADRDPTPAANSGDERRDRQTQPPSKREPVERADRDSTHAADSSDERRDRTTPTAAITDREPVDRSDESLPRITARADSDHERRDRNQPPSPPALTDRAPVERTEQSTGERRESAAWAPLPAQEPIEHIEPEPDVYRLSEAPGPLEHEENGQSAGLDVARVLEMGRQGENQHSAGAARSARALDRERAAELASEHGLPRTDAQPRDAQPSAAETSRSAATNIEAIREDEVAEIALDEDERARVAQHYGLRAIGRAVARAFGRLLIPYPNRDRRATLARMPLMYPSFREARAAYKNRTVDATGFQEAVWQLRERRRQKIWNERDRYARGALSRAQYEAKVDRIWDEFWGQR